MYPRLCSEYRAIVYLTNKSPRLKKTSIYANPTIIMASTTGIASLPTLNPVTARFQSLGQMIFGMQATGHHKWGFVIYRTTYGDQALWERYMASLRERTAWALDIFERTGELTPHLQWTVREDEAALRGATREQVRTLFRGWVAGRSVARDGPGVDGNEAFLFARVPRYRLCLFVDEECLASLATPKAIRAVVIDGEPERQSAHGDQNEEDEEDEDGGENAGNDDIDNSPEEPRFWMYLNIEYLVSLYQEAAWQSEWRNFYKPPPELYEAH